MVALTFPSTPLAALSGRTVVTGLPLRAAISEMASRRQERDGNRYYLDETGRMATGWLKLDDAWYYLRSDGSAGS